MTNEEYDNIIDSGGCPPGLTAMFLGMILIFSGGLGALIVLLLIRLTE